MSYCAALAVPLIHAWAHRREARYTPEPPFLVEAGLPTGRSVVDPTFFHLVSGLVEKVR